MHLRLRRSFIPISKRGLSALRSLASMTTSSNKGENGAKDAGKWRLEGKEYIVQDGDVIHFRFNV